MTDSKKETPASVPEVASSRTKKIIATVTGVAAVAAAGVVVARKLGSRACREGNIVYHVLPHEDGWQVKAEGASKATSIHETKKEALAAARETARDGEHAQLLIHGLDGKLQRSHTYGDGEES